MLLARALAVLVLATGLSPAQAGPWPRDVGSAFLSTGFGAERSDDGRSAHGQVYGEYGWRPGLVPALRLRLDSPLGEEGRGDAAADLRLRWHPGWTDRVALGLEGGVLADSGAERADGTRGGAAFGRTAVHLGQGLATPLGAGWLRLSLSVERPIAGDGLARREVMTQAGLRTAGGWLGVLSVSAFRQGGDTTVKLQPGLGRTIGRDRDLVLEGVLERGGARTRGLSLSLWQAF